MNSLVLSRFQSMQIGIPYKSKWYSIFALLAANTPKILIFKATILCLGIYANLS